MKAEGKIFHHGQIRHRYPFCWRSDTPLIYKVVKTWFVSVETIKDRLIEINQDINWVPEHIKDGRFGKWLENARDWAISRNRYWGTPMPLWENEDGDFLAVSSIEELEKLSGQKVTDLHRHFIDDIEFEENGKKYKRVTEVFDCWFESGSMPYAQNHFPFENKESTLENFPADFIAEGLDQTRGWFYTLTVIAAALFDKPAFKNVIVNGIVLAEDGNKMSKRLKNYPDPMKVVNKYGADSVRLYLLHSPLVSGEDFRFCERGVELVLRQMLIPFWNSYVFFATYAKICAWTPKLVGKNKPKATIDRWILSRMQKLIRDVETALNNYQLSAAVDPFVVFIDQLTNWFIRRSRPRFWSNKQSQDRDEAFQTLYVVLLNLSKVAAPFVPFLSESIFQQLRVPQDSESVHLTDYPEYRKELRDEDLEEQMQQVQTVVSMGHSLRKEHKLKTRQPLRKALLICSDKKMHEALSKHTYLIEDELNVHELVFIEDETNYVELAVKPNFKVLGRQMGPLMKEAKSVIEALPKSDVDTLYNGGEVKVTIGDKEFTLTPNEVEVTRSVKGGLVAACQDIMTVALDTELDEELICEGYAREIVNKVNTMRRNDGFEVTDRISITLDTSPKIVDAMKKHHDYISGEVLAEEVKFESCSGTEWDLNGELAIIKIEKVE